MSAIPHRLREDRESVSFYHRELKFLVYMGVYPRDAGHPDNSTTLRFLDDLCSSRNATQKPIPVGGDQNKHGYELRVLTAYNC